MNKTVFRYSLSILALCLLIQTKAHDLGTISVTGRGEVKVQPDKATVTIGVEMRHPDLDQVRGQTESRASAIITVLRNQGIEDKDILTSHTNLQPVYPYVDPWSPQAAKIDVTKPDYYVSQKTITYVLRDINKYDSVMADLYKAGINRVDSVSFGVENMEAHRQEAKKRAAANAKQVATLITEELGVKLSYAYSISENSYGDSGFATPAFAGAKLAAADSFEGVEAEAVDSAGPSISGGQITISSSVSVNFYTLPNL